jgi:hypothetical protein
MSRSALALLAALAGGLAVGSASPASAAAFYASPGNLDLTKDLTVTTTGGSIVFGNPITYQSSPRLDFGGSSATYRIDLGSPQKAGVVTFNPFAGGDTYGANMWSLEYSVDGSSWTPLSSGTNRTGPYTGDLAGNVARYVRLNASNYQTPNQFILGDVSVMAHAATPVAVRPTLNIGGQLSNAMPAWQFTPNGGSPTAKPQLNDENDNSPNPDSLGDESTLPWTLNLQMPEVYRVTGIRWHFYAADGGARDRVKDYIVEARINGGGWTLVNTNTTQAGYTYYDPFDGIYGTEGFLADELRITVTSVGGGTSTGVYLSELEVFGHAVVPEPAGILAMLLGGACVGLRRRR